MSVNKAILIGNLGKDPEIKYTTSGAAVCNFQIATSRTWKNGNGQKQEETEWHSIVTFNNLAESCAEFLRKGSKVYVEGRIKTEKWEKDGETRQATKIYAQTIQFLDTRKEGRPREFEPADMDDMPF